MESGNLLAQPQSCHGIGPGGGGSGWNVRGPKSSTEKFFWWIELFPASQQHDWALYLIEHPSRLGGR